MKVYEFHFNPLTEKQVKTAPDFVFNSFCHEPENIYEKRMGSLYMVGFLKNVLPQNLQFLDKLAKVIQTEYYRPLARKPEKALRESLRKANEFLEEIVKKGDVSWLGNLSFSVLAITPRQKLKDHELNFAKVGDLKIFLLRAGRAIDIDQKIDLEEISPWPLKIFGNIITGKLIEDDVLLILTKEISDFLEKESLWQKIEKIWPFNEREFKEIFDKKFREDNGQTERFSKISGICLVIDFNDKESISRKEILNQESYLKEFSLKEVFLPYFKILKKLPQKIASFFKSFKIKLPLKKISPAVNLPKVNPIIKPVRLSVKLNKKIILVFSFLLVLGLGYFINYFQEEKKVKNYHVVLEDIKEDISEAKKLLVFKTPQNQKKAQILLEKSWQEILQISEQKDGLPKNFDEEISSLKNEISENLFQLNKLTLIEKPELFFEFKTEEFVPEKMILFQNNIYFFNSNFQNIFELTKDKEGKLIETNEKFNLATSFDNFITFFQNPNQIFLLTSDGFRESKLEETSSDFDFKDMASFRKDLYFLDKKTGQIIKYPYQENLKWGSPMFWIKEGEEKIFSKSMAIDSSIWLLNEDNNISRYYQGQFQEEINLEIFPGIKDFKKIFTSPTLKYLYILEPAQNRIIIFDKKGEIINQFQSQKFDNLLDFAVSNDEKIIYLLNGMKVYKLTILDYTLNSQ